MARRSAAFVVTSGPASGVVRPVGQARANAVCATNSGGGNGIVRLLSRRSFPQAKRSAVSRSHVTMSSGAADSTKPRKDSFASTAALGTYIGCWYAANITFNIVNKLLLRAIPLFSIVTLMQFAMGSLAACFLWVTKLHKFHRATKAELRAIYPLALSHLLGNIFTNISLQQMAVSFTHTIKAAEPFFSVALSKIFIPGSVFHPLTYLSLLPIVTGVTLASVNEVSFNWIGFVTAMCSNVSFQSRNVLSKKCMADVDMDNLSLFGYISILSFLTLLPFALILDGSKIRFFVGAATEKGYTLAWLARMLCTAGFLHFLYNQFSYVVLQRVNPVTHAVGNTMKRVAVIVSSVLVFKNEVTLINKIGTGLAIVGVALYSQVKRLKPKAKKL